MPGYFSEKLLENLHQHQAKLLEQHLRLQLRYQAHKYKSERGREYTFNGFNRGFSERSSKCSRFCRRSAKTFQNLKAWCYSVKGSQVSPLTMQRFYFIMPIQVG